MKPYRSEQKIIYDILDTTNYQGRDGIAITPLIEKANLSYKRINPFIAKLTSNGLMNKIEVRGKNVFIITEVGRLFLEEYRKFDDFAKSMGLEL